MAGGTWTLQNKVLPGFYLNFAADQATLISLGERGNVLMPLVLDWGPERQVIRTEAATDFLTLIGHTILDPQALVIREAVKRGKYVYLYRLNSGVRASATLGNLKATARWSGVRGNDITVAIETSVIDTTKFDVITLVGGIEYDVQTVADASKLTTNDWVTFSFTSSSALAVNAGTALTGGTSAAVTNQDHVDFMSVAEKREFNTLALMGVTNTVKAIYAAFIRRLRDDIGYKAQLVVSNYAADHEGVINVVNGYQLSDGTLITADQAVAWVAGATAGATIAQALTYSAVEDSIDANPRLSRTEQEDALRAGRFIFAFSNDTAVVVQDINSLTSFTNVKSRRFAKNRVIRVLDGLANDGQRTFERYYIGKVPNSQTGRGLFRSAMVSLILAYQGAGAVQNFNSDSDISVQTGTDADAIVWEAAIEPIDSIEKIYGTFRVR